MKTKLFFCLLTIAFAGTCITTNVNAQSSGTTGFWDLKGNSATNTGINFIGTTDAKNLNFRTNNLVRMTIGATNGFVGIGNTSPGFSLDVKNDSNCTVRLKSAVAGNSNMVIDRSGTGYNCLVNYRTTGTTDWQTGCLNNTDFSVLNASLANKALTILNSNNYVGIGITAPSAPLHLKSTTSFLASFDGGSSMYIALSENGTYRGYLGSYSGAAEDVDIGTGAGNTTGSMHLTIQAVPKLTVNSSGNVGIGTTAPTQKLHVVGNVLTTGTVGAASVTATGTISGATVTSSGNVNAVNFVGTGSIDVTGHVGFGSVEEFTDGGSNTIASNSSIVPLNDCSSLTNLGSSTKRWNNIFACGDVSIGGTSPSVKLHVEGGTDVALAGGGFIVAGSIAGANVGIDNNEIMARNNGATSTLYLNDDGGNIAMCNDAGQVSIGTTLPATGYLLSVDGKIIATEVRVELFADWPDYVFDKNHKLISIEELESKINSDKHLPGVPSACEMKDNGIMLGQMTSTTMEKVEENTLYIIQLNNKIKELEKKIEELTKNNK